MAQNNPIQPEWAKPQYWPERRRAPGYPKRWLVPASIVTAITVAVFILGTIVHSPILCVLAGIGVLGLFIIYQRTLNRFVCPGCGKKLPLKWPEPGAFLNFHCQTCNVIWLTGIQTSDDVGDGGGGL